MTVEEIEIIVTAKVEEALKEFIKIAPAIKQQLKQAQEAFSKVDTKAMTNKINQAVNFMKKKIQDLKKSNENNQIAIKINNKDAQKQVNQIQKQIDSLQAKINARQMKLNITNDTLDRTRAETNQNVIKDMPDAGNKAIQQETYNRLDKNINYNALIKESDKLNNEIIRYNSLLDTAKAKMAQLSQQTTQTATTQNKLSSFFGTFKQKIEQAKLSISNMKNSFSQMPKITQNITNNIKGIGNGLKQGVGHILKYATTLLSLKGIYSTLSNCASTWLSSQNASAKQLSANIDYMKYAMGSALAPVIQFVTNLVYQLMKAIQSVVYALTGVNIFANASAKSYASMAGNAKKAKQETKQLAGIHDEINNIQNNDNSDSGSGSGGGVTPSFDLSQIDNQMLNWIDSIKQKLATLFEPIQNAWNQYGQPLIESMKYAFNSTLGLIQTIGKSFKEVWLNGTGEHTVGTILQILTSIFNTIGNINIAFKNAWENNGGTEIIQNLWNAFNNILDIILSIQQTFEEWTASQSFQDFANAIISICSTLSYWFELITQKLKEIWENGGKQAFTSLLEVISKVVQVIDAVLQVLTPVVEYILSIVTPIILGIIQTIGFLLDAIGGIIDFIVGVFTGDWDKAWSGIKEFFIGIWNAIKTIITTVLSAIKSIWESIWNGISTFITNIWNGIKNIASSVFDGIKNTISNAFNTIRNTVTNIWNGIVNTISNVWNTIVSKVKQGVSGAWNAITSVFGNVGNWFKDKFSQAWQAVKNVFSSGGAIFDGIKDGILNGLKTIVNAIIRGINKVISIPFNGINSALKAIKSVDIMGLRPFSWINTIGVPQIPQLAKGGVLYDETLVMAGEYSGASSNPEIVTPQNIMEETFDKVMSRYQVNNNDVPINLAVYVGNTKLGQVLLEHLRNMKRQTGKDIEALVGG